MSSQHVYEEMVRTSGQAKAALSVLDRDHPLVAGAVRQRVMREMAEGYSDLDPDSEAFILAWATQVLLELQTQHAS